MAVDAPKQASRRSRRLQVVGRLTALLGVPLLILFTVFSSGVFFGASRSYRVQVLEAEFLGLERLSDSASLIDATRASFAVLFGVEVQLQGIVIWDAVNVSGGPDARLADLAAREREGADVIIAIVAQPEPEDFEPKSWTGAEHGDHALVYADLRQSDRYHRNLLRTLAQLLGATPTTDTAAKQLGSFMSDAEVAAGAAPTIDPDNRRVAITNKGRPFAHAGEEI